MMIEMRMKRDIWVIKSILLYAHVLVQDPKEDENKFFFYEKILPTEIKEMEIFMSSKLLN